MVNLLFTPEDFCMGFIVPSANATVAASSSLRGKRIASHQTTDFRDGAL